MRDCRAALAMTVEKLSRYAHNDGGMRICHCEK